MPIICRICFVCWGNICRSPLAAAILIDQLQQTSCKDSVTVDSAGMSDWNIGAKPDPRSIRCAERHGLTLRSRAQQFAPADFDRFDWIIAMDEQNQHDLMQLARHPADQEKIKKLASFTTSAEPTADVADPYYADDELAFEDVFTLCEQGCAAVIRVLQTRYDQSDQLQP